MQGFISEFVFFAQLGKCLGGDAVIIVHGIGLKYKYVGWCTVHYGKYLRVSYSRLLGSNALGHSSLLAVGSPTVFVRLAFIMSTMMPAFCCSLLLSTAGAT